MATPSPRRRTRETPEAFERRTSQRLGWICAGLVGTHIVLLGNLYRVQIARHAELSKESRQHWQVVKTLRPERGLIYDRNGALLIQNEPGFAVVVNPNRWFHNNNPAPEVHDSPRDRRERALIALRRAFPKADLAALEKLDLSRLPTKAFPPFEVVSWITGEEVEALRQLGADLAPPIPPETRKAKGALAHPKEEIPGVGFPATTRRVALHGTRAAHILGFTDPRGNEARLGIESSQDAQLTGTAVKAKYEFDGFGLIPGTEQPVLEKGMPAALRNRTRPIPGADITLTIDAELQHDVEQSLGAAVVRHQAEAGVAIVLDASNGDILAMASAPTYNINDARNPKDAPPQDHKSRRNWCVELPYEPGSTLKTLTIAAALEKKVVGPTATFHCTGARRILNNRIHCAAHGSFTHGHGTQDLAGVLTHSCNLATAECGERLGAKNLYRFLTDFGLGSRTKVGLPFEARGQLRNPSRSVWQPIDLANISFGQGLSVTPLQLAAAYTTFVDGTYHAPRLIQSYRQPDTGKRTDIAAVPGRRVLSEATAREMREMLRAVVERGTGQLAQMTGYTAGGKTGTAQISENGRYGGRYVASFIGLAPLDKPRFVILTMVRAPKGAEHFGGTVAGPVFKEIAEKALLLHRIPQDKRGDSQPDPNEKKRRQSNAAEA